MAITESEQLILNHILDIKIDISSIKERLDSSSKLVAKNASDIKDNKRCIEKNELFISKWIGGLVVITFIANFAGYYLLN